MCFGKIIVVLIASSVPCIYHDVAHLVFVIPCVCIHANTPTEKQQPEQQLLGREQQLQQLQRHSICLLSYLLAITRVRQISLHNCI